MLEVKNKCIMGYNSHAGVVPEVFLHEVSVLHDNMFLSVFSTPVTSEFKLFIFSSTMSIFEMS